MNKNESAKLDKIILQNEYIIKLLEQVVDDAYLVSQLQESMRKKEKIIRELEYEKWFENNKKKSDGKRKSNRRGQTVCGQRGGGHQESQL